MASGQSIIVGGGIQSGSPFVLNRLIVVTNVNPPQASSIFAGVATDSVSAVVYLNIPNAAGLSLTTALNAQETFRVRGGIITSGTGTDSTQIGRGASATGTDGISIGRGSSATGTDALAIGRGSGATVTKTTIVGSNSNDNGQQCTVVGWGSGALSTGGIAIGIVAVISGNAGSAYAIAIGDNSTASLSSAGGGNAIAIGKSAQANTEDTVIGCNATSSVQSTLGNFSVVIGHSASANVSGGNVYGVVIGWGGVLTQKQAVVIGGNAQATAAGGQTRSVVIGSGSISTATDAIILGGGTTLTTKSIAIGAGAVDLGAGFLQLGAAGTPITTVVVGAGDTIAGPAAKTIRFTNATGSDNVAGAVTFVAPLSTGAGTPAVMNFQVGVAHGSDAVLQTATTMLQLDASTTAADIRMQVFDVTAAALVRVSRGASDSGGVGFRVLRVPN